MKQSIYWREAASPSPAAPLERDIDAEFVGGGGMAGLSAAQWLIERGEKGVVLLEAEQCGGGASGHNSGSIIPVAVQDLHQLLYRFGAGEGACPAHAVTRGLRMIRETVRSHAIDCGILDTDTLHAGTASLLARRVGKEHEARLSLGLPSRHYDADELPGIVGTDIFRADAVFGGSFGMNSYRYLLGLRDALEEQSLRVFENTRVRRIEPGRVITARAAVRCRKVIVCVDRFAPDLGIGNDVIHHQQHFIAVSEPLDEGVRRRLFPGRPLIVHALARHYHYLRLTPEGRLVLGGMPLRRSYARRSRDPLPEIATGAALVPSCRGRALHPRLVRPVRPHA